LRRFFQKAATFLPLKLTPIILAIAGHDQATLRGFFRRPSGRMAGNRLGKEGSGRLLFVNKK
jgi:hypothetical protein